MSKKIAKLLAKILGVILLLLIVLLLLLRIPAVQTKIAQMVTKRLSKQLDTEISIDRVAMNFIDNASIKGLYIEDLQDDTLLYVRDFTVDIAFFKLFKKIIEIDKASLTQGVVKVSENQDSIYNFQFIVDAFSSEDTTTSSAPFPFTIDLDLVQLQEVKTEADLLSGDHQLMFDDLSVQIEKFDLNNQSFQIGKLSLDGLAAESIIEAVDSDNEGEVIEDTSSQIEFPLSSLPITLGIRQLSINEAYLSYKERGASKADTFSTKYIDLNALQLDLSDLQVNAEQLDGSIDQISLNLNEKFVLEEFKGKVHWNESELKINDFLLKLPNSEIKAQLESRYENFAQLVEVDESTFIDLNIPDLLLSFDDISYFVSDETLGPLKSKKLKANASVKGQLSRLLLEKLNLNVGETSIRANGRILNVTDTEALAIEDFKINGTAGYKEYVLFLPNDTLKEQMQSFGNIRVQAAASGDFEELLVENLEVYTESLAEAKFSGKLMNLTDTDNLAYDVKIHHITSGYEDAAVFVDSLPDMIQKFDTISYSGRAEGDLYDINLNGGFTTSLGDLQTDIAVAFTSEYEDAVYSGQLVLEEFQLGELLNNDSLGTLSMELELDGSGLETKDLQTEIDALISKFEYNDYVYNDIEIEGLVNGLEFSGKAKVDDENLRLDFDGSIDMNDSIPVMNFDLDLDTLNLAKLNLADSMFQIQLKVNANIAGLNPDDADGQLVVRDIKLIKEEQTWTTDSIQLIAEKQNGEKGLYLNGEFIEFSVKGDYQLSLLPDVILDFLDKYFPLKTFLGRSKGEDPILSEQEKQRLKSDVIDAHLELYDVEEVAQFFDFPIEKMDTTTLDFKLDVPNNLTEFEFVMPALTYDGFYIENVRAIANNNPDLIKSSLKIDSVSLSESVHLAGVNLDMIFRDQSAVISSLIRNQKNEKSLGFSTRIVAGDTSDFNVNFIKDFILNDQKWNLNQESAIVLEGSQFEIPPINLNNGSEAFNISGSNKKIDLSFTDFNLNNFIDIVGIDSLEVTGLMNGDLEVGLDDETPISGDLLINNIQFNEYQIGDLDLDATKEGQDVSAVISLKGEEVNLDGDMEYDLSSSYLFGKVLIERLNLEPLNPLVQGYADKLGGSMQGYLAVEGELEKPYVTGALYFQEVEAFIKDLGTDYRIKEGKINVKNGIILPDATLEDQEGRLSYLEGEITHDFFTDIQFDLDFNAEEFMFLNSKQNKREYYYGTFVGRVDAEIKGSAELPIINADITALDKTDLTIQLLSSEAVLTKEDYIIFYDGSEIDSEEAIDSISRTAYQPNSSLELNLQLSASESALFHVIVDPVTGDRLDIRGSTDLIVTIPPDGSSSIIGEYVVTEGRYRVSYENTIRRTFDLDAGSRMVFQGDPYNAILDMRAIYSAEVNTFALIEDASSSLDDGSASARTEVNVVLNVSGTLADPVLSFDIKVPEVNNSPVGNAVSDALAQLRQNETQLLEQVGSIILFNSFIGGSSGGNISSVGTSTAVNSVGNLINTQLNKLASRAEGFEVDFNIDQYRDETRQGNANVTEFGIGLQQRLFNDRLIISAGGNANLETGQQTDNNFSSFAGDFVIQYLLTPSGRFRVKVFQRSDFNALDNDNIWKTGVGLSYKKQFGQIKPKEK